MVFARFSLLNTTVLGATLASAVLFGATNSALANPSAGKPTRPSATSNQAAVADSDLRPLALSSSLLSLPGGQRLMNEANTAFAAQNYAVAAKRLQDARQVFNQLSNFYQDLTSLFAGVDNRVAAEQRQKAVNSAQMRDQATYQLALVHRAQNQPELAVPLLVQVIRSQQPTREWGQKAYQQLQELGFVDTLYPRAEGSTPSPTQPAADAPAAPTTTPSQPAPATTDLNSDLRPLALSSSVLSLAGGRRLLNESNTAFAAQNYDLAAKRLQDARQVFNQLSNFYQDLAGVFAGADSQVSSELRQKALDSAQLRDQTTYQLAVVHRAQGQPELSVPLLVQVIRSQQPGREWGQKAYQQLQEIGFVDTVYPRGDRATSSTATANQPAATDSRPLALSNSLLSLPGGRLLMTEASTASTTQNYDVAAKRLQDARQIFNQLSNFYQDLAAVFAGADNRVAKELRQKALDGAQLRDQATYELALVHRAQNQPELAVPLLVQILRSQQPGRELGQKAYQQLFDIGFVNLAYPRADGAASQPPAGADQRPLALNTSLLSLPGGRRLMDEASTAVSSQNYDLAAKRLQDARQIFNQLSNFYQDLSSIFAGVDSQVVNEQRQKALDSAQMRDQTTYQLALVHRAQNQLELAVPLLVQVIRSQQPGRELGQKAYQQLLEMGFVDMAYPRADAPATSIGR